MVIKASQFLLYGYNNLRMKLTTLKSHAMSKSDIDRHFGRVYKLRKIIMTWNKNSSAQNISITLIIIHKWEVINPFSIHGIHSISSKVMLSIATSGQLDKRWKKGNKLHQTPTSHFWSHCILISWHSWVNDQPIPVTQNTISNSMLYQ